MAILPIAIYPAPILKRRAMPVAQITAATRQLLTDMLATMYAAPGVGLAAPQVGVGLRVLVIDIGEPVPMSMEESAQLEERTAHPYQLINPEIIERAGTITWEEGCLSLPELLVTKQRAAHVVVTALDPEGAPVTIDAHGLLAVVLQHEIDHLDGKLIIDDLSRLKRSMYLDRLKKQQAEQSPCA